MYVNATEVKVMKAGPHQTQSHRSASELLSLRTEHWNKNCRKSALGLDGMIVGDDGFPFLMLPCWRAMSPV